MTDAQLNDVISGFDTRVKSMFEAEAGKPLDPQAARDLATQVEYKATVVMDKAPEKPQPNPGEFLVGVFQLCAILLGLCLALGLIFAGVRVYGSRWSGKKEEDGMTSLGI